MEYEFNSVFGPEMNDYKKFRQDNGVTTENYLQSIKDLDEFLIENGVTEKKFTKELADKWIVQMEDESDTHHYKRINRTKLFVSYLFTKGYDVHLFDDVRFIPSDFVPYIYNEDETLRYFKAVDGYYMKGVKERANPLTRVMLPVIFRVLQGCGTRITETLQIRKNDVNLDDGVIRLRETKFHKERIVVMSNDLTELMNSYADKTFYMLKEEDFIFHKKDMSRYSADTIHDIHLNLLQMAGIPRRGNELGPRLHDWRHTWAVRAFKQMWDAGYDLYAALPIISVYMGHETVWATEKYIRLVKHNFPEIDDKVSARFESVMKGDADEE